MLQHRLWPQRINIKAHGFITLAHFRHRHAVADFRVDAVNDRARRARRDHQPIPAADIIIGGATHGGDTCGQSRTVFRYTL
jgi:hypothetical protein